MLALLACVVLVCASMHSHCFSCIALAVATFERTELARAETCAAVILPPPPPVECPDVETYILAVNAGVDAFVTFAPIPSDEAMTVRPGAQS